MQNIKINLEKLNDQILVHIEGSIDENFSQFSQSIPDQGQLVFNLDRLKSINSTGIREWIKLMQKLSKAAVSFKNCPKIFIDQLNMVSGFIPPRSKILSFYVPYFSEELDQEIKVLYQEGADYQGNKIQIREEYKDEKGQSYELDVVKAKYFKFLES